MPTKSRVAPTSEGYFFVFFWPPVSVFSFIFRTDSWRAVRPFLEMLSHE